MQGVAAAKKSIRILKYALNFMDTSLRSVWQASMANSQKKKENEKMKKWKKVRKVKFKAKFEKFWKKFEKIYKFKPNQKKKRL